ncbi:MAG: MMPL family transporter, partial [Planctomycetales bacterium]|nr:MMPL family transporter [Planctomycetales bacterium]
MVFLLLGLLTLVCGAGLKELRVDDRLRDLFRSQNDDYRQLEMLQARFGADDNDLLLLIESPSHLIDERGIAGLRATVDRLEQLPEIARVRSILDARGDRKVGRYILPLIPAGDADEQRLERARAEAAAHPLVQGQVLSADGRTSVMIATLSGDISSMAVLQPRLQRVRAAIDEVAREHQLQIGVTGVPALRSDMTEHIQRSQPTFAIATLVLSSLAALAFYRSWSALLISGIGPVLGLICTMGLLGWLGIPITPITSIVPPLVFVVGMTDSVHLLFHIQDELRRGRSHQEAAMNTFSEMWVPCGLTSLTTSMGFATLMLTPLEAVRTFGIACAIGTAMNFVTVMLSAPLLATTPLGRRLGLREPGSRFAAWLARLVDGRHRVLAVAGAVATAALLPCWLSLRADNRAGEFLPQNSDAARVLAATEQQLGGALQAQVMVQWSDDATAKEVVDTLRAVESEVAQLSFTSKPVSLATLLETLPTEHGTLEEQLETFDEIPEEATAGLVHFDSGSAIVRASMRDVGAAAALPELDRLEARLGELQRLHPGWVFTVTGTTAVSYRTGNHMIAELTSSLLLAAGLIFVSLAVIFRSLRLALAALIPNLLPFG